MTNGQNDWDRMADSLNHIKNTILNNTHNAQDNTDSITIHKDSWINAILELQRNQKQCTTYGQQNRKKPNT